MGNNTELDPAAGGDVIDTEEISGVKTQVMKVAHGAIGNRSLSSIQSPFPIRFGDSPSVDAAGRLRVAEPHTVFETKLLRGNKELLLWDEALESGSGASGTTPTIFKPYIDFTNVASTASVYTRQTKRRFGYQPGKSQKVEVASVIDLSGGGTELKRRVGLFDDNNGFFFEEEEGVRYCVHRTSDSGTPVDTRIGHTLWNIDQLDGNGPSGIVIDWTKIQIFVIDFQWLSAGRIRWGLEINGILWYVHEYSSANVSSTPISSTPNLPLRFQMISTANSPLSTMRVISATVVTEGGQDPVGIDFADGTDDHIDCNTADTFYAIVGMRLKTTHLGATIDIRGVSVIAETSDDFEWRVLINPTINGAFVFVDKEDSSVQTVIGATENEVTGGHMLASGFARAEASAQGIPIDTAIKLGAMINGDRDEIVLAVRPLSSNADIQGCLNWRELF